MLKWKFNKNFSLSRLVKPGCSTTQSGQFLWKYMCSYTSYWSSWSTVRCLQQRRYVYFAVEQCKYPIIGLDYIAWVNSDTLLEYVIFALQVYPKTRWLLTVSTSPKPRDQLQPVVWHGVGNSKLILPWTVHHSD